MRNPKFLRIHHPKPQPGTPPCLLEELIRDILSWLPSKFLCRFKCVSKDFLFSISSDSQFKDLHRSRFLKKPLLLQYDLRISDDGPCGSRSKYLLTQTTFDLASGQECDKFDLAISKASEKNAVSEKNASFLQVTSCRELVCIYSDRQILVLNPRTHQFTSLGVENEIMPNSVGIGYVDSCKEYKVVQIIRARNRLRYRDRSCQVYTLNDGIYGYTVSPKIFEGPLQNNFYDAGFPELLPICVDGVLYWMSITRRVENKLAVNYLNLKDNSFGKIPFREGDKVEKDERGATMAKLVELQGYLCVQCSSLRSNNFLVYALKDTKLGLWEQLYNIPYPTGIKSRMSLMNTIMTRHEITESLAYRPAMSSIVPHVVGFLPSNNSGKGVPNFVISQYIDDVTSRVHVVENGTIKTSADIRFNTRKTRRLLYYNEGLFSFKSL